MDHHYHHVRHHPNSVPNTSELLPKSNSCVKTNPVGSSCPIQSCEGSTNVHPHHNHYKLHHYKCAIGNLKKGHHHFCSSLYQSQSEHHLSRGSSIQCFHCNHHQSCHHISHGDPHHSGCFETDAENEDNHNRGITAMATCLKCHTVPIQPEHCSDSAANSKSIGSLLIWENNKELINKHKKHKRCHHYPPLYCAQRLNQKKSRSNTVQSKVSNCEGSVAALSNNGNDAEMNSSNAPAFCNNVLSPVMDNLEQAKKRHLISASRSLSNSNSNSSPADKDSSCGLKSDKCPNDENELIKNNSSQDKQTSSSCEKVHIMKNSNCPKHGNTCIEANGRAVIFTRNHKKDKLTGSNLLPQQTFGMKQKNQHFSNQKRASIFTAFLRRLSISARLTKTSCESGVIGHNFAITGIAVENESSESCSPYSSTNSLHRNNPRRHHHHHHHCHHYKCYTCQPLHRRSHTNCIHSQAIKTQLTDLTKEPEPEDIPCNSLPMEEQREILRQALQETTTIQEAVAVVEELSSGGGARISSLGSGSSSSKKA